MTSTLRNAHAHCCAHAYVTITAAMRWNVRSTCELLRMCLTFPTNVIGQRHRKMTRSLTQFAVKKKMSLATLMCVCLLFFFCMFVYRASVLSLFSRSFIYFFVYLFFLICYLLCCLFCWLAACLVDLGKTFFFPSENKTRLSHKLSQTHTHTNYTYIHSVIYTQTRAHKETRAQTSS